MSRLDTLKARLQELEISPKRSLGQNFLIGDHVIEKIIAEVRATHSKHIIEVGPGLGALTEELVKLDLPIQLIELDRAFSQFWRDKGLELIEGDALKIDWSQWSLPDKTVLVSNLPYQIGASLVIERSLQPLEILPYQINI